MKENVLEVKNLKKRYKDFFLKNVSFDVQSNTICGFIGVNGAGKSTTIKAMLGLIKKDYGEISFFGKRFAPQNKDIFNRIGVVFDSSYFYSGVSVEQMKQIIAPSYSRWSDETFYKLLEKYGISKKMKINELSKGMKMKVSLAFAMSHGAELLIMDEPTSGLDPLIRSQLIDTLIEFKNINNNAVFFSTHITSDLDKAADKLVMLHAGEIVFSYQKKEVVELLQGKSIEDYMLTCIEERRKKNV